MQSVNLSSNQSPGACGVQHHRFSVRYMTRFAAGVAVFVASLTFLPGCKKDMEFDSNWREKEITVDGDDTEWQDHLMYFENKPVAVGIKNDSADIYLLFKTTDNPMKQTVMRTGFSIWFNANGKKKKTFGIRYPLGLMRHQQLHPYDPEEWRMRREERLKIHMSDMLTELEILGPGGNVRNHTSVENPYGITVGLTDTSAALIYELKIPLRSSEGHHYQIGAEPGSVIRVGLETGNMDSGQIVRRPGSGSGMGGGQGGGIRRGGSQGRGTPRMGMRESL